MRHASFDRSAMKRELSVPSPREVQSSTTHASSPGELERGSWASPRPWLILLGETILFLVVAAGVLWPAPIHSNELPAAYPDSDLMISHWPSAILIKRTIALEHRLPLWNPFFAGGRPLAADPLAAMFYPPTQLMNFFPLRDYYLILLLGHLMLAGFGTLLLARRAFHLTRWPALVAAVSFMATPRLISHLGAGHFTVVQTVAWYPWLALGAWATVRNPRRWAAPFGVILGLTLLAGHPQMAYYGLLMTGVVALWLLFTRYRQATWRDLRAPVAGLIAAGVTGLLLATIHLLPLAQFTALSTRQDDVAATDKYPIVQFMRALIGHPPASNVPWENVIQPGGVVLMLATLGAIAAGRRALPLLGGIVVVATLAMGNASPVFYLAAHVLPEFNRFHGLSRIWLVALLGIALLAGLGTEALLGLMRGYDERLVRRGQLALGIFALLLVTSTLIKTDQGRAQVGSITFSTTPSPRAKRVAELAGSSRVYGVQRNLWQLGAVDLSMRLADGWDPLMIESYVRYMQPAGGYTFTGYQLTIPALPGKPNPYLLGLMDVGIVVSDEKLDDPNLKFIQEMDKLFIYRNTLDAGPAYLVQPDQQGNAPTLGKVQPSSNGVAPTLLSREEDRFSVKTSDAAYLVVADPYYPGWKATVDGHDAKITTIDNVLPAIKLDPGTHTVVYHYEPAVDYAGAVFSGLGLILVAGGLIFGWAHVIELNMFSRRPSESPVATDDEEWDEELEQP